MSHAGCASHSSLQSSPVRAMRLPPDLLNLERERRHHDLPERRKNQRQHANPVARFRSHSCARFSHA